MNENTIHSIIAIIVAFASLIISSVVAIKSWHKNRVMYELKECILRKFNGTSDDVGDRGLGVINENLKNGKYVIQSIQERKEGDWAVLLARIKK